MVVLRRLAVAVLVSMVAFGIPAQSILTVAGGGTLDGQLATNVPISTPGGIAFDRAGNVYVASYSGGQVLRIDAGTRIVKVVAGNGASGFTGDGGPGNKATLRRPAGLAIDSADNLYIADTLNNRVRRVDAKTGIISTFAGGGTPADGSIGDGGQAAAAELGDPWGLLIDRGFLYITENAYNAHRLRRVNLSSGIIETVAGRTDRGDPGFSGDGGPAKNAVLDNPLGIAADSAGNIYFVDNNNKRVRRIDTNGVINTYAGGGATQNTGDGIQATDAYLDAPTVITFDKEGNLLIASIGSIRRVDKTTHVITTALDNSVGLLYGMATAADGTVYFSWDQIYTVAPGSRDHVPFGGGGTYVGDELPAAAAVLRAPYGLALDSAGNLFIADAGQNIIRRVSAADGTISTIAGSVGHSYNADQNNIDASQSIVGFPVDVAFDPSGNLYIADFLNGAIWRIDKTTNILTRYAGGGSPTDGFGDGGPALSANVVPWGLAFDSAGNLYIADRDSYATPPHARVRKIDAATKTIITVAGSTLGYSGDGGPATSAQLADPLSVVIDNAGNIIISEYGNGVIRKVDRAGIITTIAGSPMFNEGTPLGDEGPAKDARIDPLHMAFNRLTGDLIFTDFGSHRVRRIDAQNIIHTVAGSGNFYYEGGFSGDNGPAKDAKLAFDYGDAAGIAIAPSGDIYFSDSQNNRVRAVFACVTVSAPQLTSPANNSAASTSPKLTWNEVKGAFRYDVRVDTITPPQRVIASDVTETSFTPSLAPGTKYFWSVTAKGDQFCPSVSTATSAISSFTTAAGCGVAAFDSIAPADGAQHVALNPGLTVTLSWQAAGGATSYDVYVGPNNPPALVKTGITATSYDAAITQAGTLFWFVIAHGACAEQTATSSIRSFSPEFFGFCSGSPNVAIAAPASGAVGVSSTVDLTWTDTSGVVSGFDVFFGTNSNPPLLRTDLASTVRSVTVPFLDTGATYFWKVVAHSACGTADVSTPVASFTTLSCAVPGGTQVLFSPPSVSTGATYTVVWSAATGLEADGVYLIERSTLSSFASILDSQVTSSTAASFVAGTPGTVYHRVRAVPACDPTKTGPPSSIAAVNVVNAPANIIVTVPPRAVVTALGEKIENQSGSFTIENIGSVPAQIIVGQSELPGSRPFFSIAEGGAFVTLQPRVPRTFGIQYSGPPNNVAGSYQGVIFAVGVTQPLPVTPYAFVNLKVGGGPAVAPEFIIDGTPGEYAAFPGFSGDDDSNRPAREISIRNPGTTPMELAAEVGPEVWLVPENGWNTQPLAPGATRAVKLFTRRPFAPSGSPLPRYTYFTVRTKDGASSRLLVQDNDNVAVSNGRATALDATARSFIVPDGSSRLRLSNNGGDAVQVELIFTPSGADGFSNAVKRVVVVVPSNDVVTLTNPVVQVFGFPAGTLGQIEVRMPRDRLGLVAVRAGVPVVARGEGARVGAPHALSLPVTAPTTLTLIETTGSDKANVTINVTVATATQTITQDVLRYGMVRIDAGSPSRIDITVNSGGGSVVAIATTGAAALVSRPVTDTLAKKLGKGALAGVPSVTTVVPVISGVTSAGAAPTFRTAIGLTAQSAAANFAMTFYPATGGVALNRPVSVAAGQTTVYNDVMRDLFAVSNPSDGSLYVQGPPNGKVIAVLQTAGSGASPAAASALPIPNSLSEAITSASGASRRPLSYDGLEQSVDPTRGSRWLLLLNEMSGGTGFVNVRLYEAGNRSRPIAEKDLTISANQQLKLDTVFAALGLDTAERRKDRTNVEVVVTATAGTAQIAASAVSIDNRTGATSVAALTPAVGSGNPNVSFVTPVVTAPPSGGRRRAVGH